MSIVEGGGRIRVLSELVRNQIAAGEVIERPASVVKELIENAIDAGARAITVELEEGGARSIRVGDDGCGMGAADLALAFEPHATSKLESSEDLEHVASLGFRGEALASMGSVARCSIYSREAQAEVGARIENAGGRQGPVQAAGGPRGTIVEVRDLFFNTPARRRFLKRSSTELSHCLDVVQRAALAQAGVGFSVTNDGRRALDVEARMDLGARVRRLFGAELADALVAVEARDGDTRLAGFVAPPRFSRRDTARQMWFLNGRSLRDKLLARALREGYRGFLVEGRQPVAFLQLALDPAKVDVNVHPAKAEVRFREGQRLFGFLVNALRDAVRRTDMATPGERMLAGLARRGESAVTQGGLPIAHARGAPPPDVVRPVRAAGLDDSPRPLAPASPRPTAASSVAEPGPAWEAVDDLRGPYLQIARTYIVRALPDGFEIVDQHALHERVTFEQLRTEQRAGGIGVQRLLVPELVELSRAEVERLAAHLDALRGLGIELSIFGGTTVAVQGLPARLRRPDAEGLVRDLVALLAAGDRLPSAEDVLEEVLHSAACRSSVMAGDELDEEEIRALLERGRELDSDQTCPHARPTRVRFRLADLEKAFHRR